mmetsp:Transcript_18617/g.34274  ORF Transcript_18617/g.34274 Transcript_18617/m.34274 type:complete len:263 (+) Transcript_18617:227-1015(+)
MEHRYTVSLVVHGESQEVDDEVGDNPAADEVPSPVDKEEQARLEAERIKEESMAKRYRGIGKKRKRRYTRVLREETGRNANTSANTFNHAEAQSAHNLPPTAPSQQVASTISPPTPRSPLKKQLKKDIQAMAEEDSRKEGVISKLKKSSEMAKKHNAQTTKIESELVASLTHQANAYDKHLLKWKEKLGGQRQKLKDERLKWEIKMTKQGAALESANNRVRNEKLKNRQLIHEHVAELAKQESDLNLIIQDLQDETFDMAEE